MAEKVYSMKNAIPNKLLSADGTITDLNGNAIDNATEAYQMAPALPDKVLMPDGTYTKLSDIIKGGSSGGTTNYNDLTNKPSINGTPLVGNQTAEQLGLIQKTGDTPQAIDTDIEIENGKNLTLKDSEGTTQSALSANADGTITAEVKVGDETKTEKVAYVSDIDKKVTNVLGGEY